MAFLIPWAQDKKVVKKKSIFLCIQTTFLSGLLTDYYIYHRLLRVVACSSDPSNGWVSFIFAPCLRHSWTSCVLPVNTAARRILCEPDGLFGGSRLPVLSMPISWLTCEVQVNHLFWLVLET